MTWCEALWRKPAGGAPGSAELPRGLQAVKLGVHADHAEKMGRKLMEDCDELGNGQVTMEEFQRFRKRMADRHAQRLAPQQQPAAPASGQEARQLALLQAQIQQVQQQLQAGGGGLGSATEVPEPTMEELEERAANMDFSTMDEDGGGTVELAEFIDLVRCALPEPEAPPEALSSRVACRR